MLSHPAMIAGRYLVRQQLGLGSQGEVYEVLDTHEGDVVALKLLGAFPAGAAWNEAFILRRLSDPHILPIRNADLAVGRPYLVTELARHGTVHDRLVATGSCGVLVDDVVRWIRHACYGTARAHDMRLLHNDLKPQNLFLNAQGECLVGDFGFASLIPTGATTAVPPGVTAETVAPEIAASWSAMTAVASIASDVYSLGATGFWLLAGRSPHDLTSAPDVPAKMAIVASTQPPRLRDLAPHVPQYVAAAIERAIARVASDRFASVTELAAALGARPGVARRWRRTDEHTACIACWRGEPAASGSTYVLCLEPGPTSRRRTITTRHASGNRINQGCRSTTAGSWAQAVRAVMRDLA